MQQRTIGDRTISAIGLGGMPMSIEGHPDAQRSSSTFHAALDAGGTLIDTADAYHRDANEVGHNEELIARALRDYGVDADDVLVVTKGGHLRPGDGTWTRNGDPEYLKRAVKGVRPPPRRRRDRSLTVPPPRPRCPLRPLGRCENPSTAPISA